MNRNVLRPLELCLNLEVDESRDALKPLLPIGGLNSLPQCLLKRSPITTATQMIDSVALDALNSVEEVEETIKKHVAHRAHQSVVKNTRFVRRRLSTPPGIPRPHIRAAGLLPGPFYANACSSLLACLSSVYCLAENSPAENLGHRLYEFLQALAGRNGATLRVFPTFLQARSRPSERHGC